MQLLRIDSSARSAHSVTRQLTAAYCGAWLQQHPGAVVVERDLAATSLPHVTPEWSGTYLAAEQLSAAQRAYLRISDELTGELLASEAIVIGAPMYNFTISWELKAWVDQIVRLGRTVARTSQGLVGLAGGRRVTVVTARGGDYSAESSHAALDHQEPYLRDVLAFIGITDVQFVHADRQLTGDAKTRLAQALEQAAQAATVAAS